MQTSKDSRNGSTEAAQKTSPVTAQRKLKIPASSADSVPSPNRAINRTPKEKSPKVVDRRSSNSPATERKSSLKVTELESQISLLQEELKKTKDQLTSSESIAKQSQEEAEAAKNELVATSAKLDASQKQLTELLTSESAQPENLEGSQNLKAENLEGSQNPKAENLEGSQNLKAELTEALSLVENLKCQLSECEKSESQAMELLTDSQVKLEMAKTVEENLRTEVVQAEEAYKLVVLKLEKLKLDEAESSDNKPKSELFEAKAEVEKLKSALGLIETRFQEENIQSTLLIRNAQEQEENTKAELAIREVEMAAELEKLKAEADKNGLKAARLAEQLEALQGANAEMEAELRRLKVQSDQWRKAAEAAAAMISSGGQNGKLVERTGSFDKGGYNTIGSKLGSPFEDFIDESPKKKNNGSMLKKFGVFLKKGQK